jgi:LexA-binding, inner membrane-associated putative hydrolase
LLVGHLAAGFIAKSIEPKVSLGTWVAAVLLADLIFFPLLIAGIEHVDIAYVATDSLIGRDDLVEVATNRVVGRDIIYSHSLAMLVIWAGLFAAIYFWRKRYARGALLLFGAVLSHWVLDVISHRPDMPLAPGLNKVFGLGLWNSIPATLIVEGGFWLLAIIIYARITRPRNRLGVYAFWVGVVLLTLVWYANITSGMVPDPVQGGISGLISFSLVTAWAYWVNHLRLISFEFRVPSS